MELGIACSDENTALSLGYSKVTFRVPKAMTLSSINLNVNTAPTGADIHVMVKLNGSNITSSDMIIPAGAKTSVGTSQPSIAISSFAFDDEITVDINQVGSTNPGAGLKMWMIGERV